MNEQIERLINIGFKPHEAVRIYKTFMVFIDIEHLDKFINDLESEGYHPNVQQYV